MTQLPTRNDINIFDSLDERIACDHFLGKSLDDAEVLFRESPLMYHEDLMWMGPVAFRFYVIAVIRYIQSDFAIGDSDIINCYGGLLEFRLENEEEELIPVATQIAASCDYIVKQVERFDIESTIYGDISGRFLALAPVALATGAAKPIEVLGRHRTFPKGIDQGHS